MHTETVTEKDAVNMTRIEIQEIEPMKIGVTAEIFKTPNLIIVFHNDRPVEFVLMEELNSLPKFEDAGKPFTDIWFVPGNGGWWAECPRTGFGYWYKTFAVMVKPSGTEGTTRKPMRRGEKSAARQLQFRYS